MLKKTYWNSMKSENCIIPSYYNNHNTNDLIRQRVINQDLTNYGAAGRGSYYLQSQTNATKVQPVSFSSATVPCMGIPSSFYPHPQNVYTSYASGPTTVLFMEHPSKKSWSQCISLCLAFVVIFALLVGVAAWIHLYEGQAKPHVTLNTIKRILISTSLDDDFETILEDVGP